MNHPVSLIVGLGNPGPEYAFTRHNAGALWVAYLAQQHRVDLRVEKKFHGLYGKIAASGGDVHLLFPGTFMNRSGLAVRSVAQFFKIAPENILVAHDELDIPCGTVRLKRGGGHGGHNGLRDIIAQMGNQQAFGRVRLGIGHPGHKEKVHGHVLGRLNETESRLLEDVFWALDREFDALMQGDWSGPMNRLHQLKPETKPS